MTTAVAIALYNGEKFLKKQLDSIRLQTRQPNQVVLCDDGSKDGTVQLVTDYIEKYGLQESWSLYCNQQNLGYIKNFYKAISLCDTDLVFLCDQDDIWDREKIDKMTAVMQKNNNILLLSGKYGIIDADDREIKSFLEKKSEDDYALQPVTIEDIMRAYRWPGMIMCIRKDFFDRIIDDINDIPVAHDLAFVTLAADQNGFYEYGYTCAFHRRHTNNTAKEEHRISKLLNLKRKLSDIDTTLRLWDGLLSDAFPLQKVSKSLILQRYGLLVERRDALQNKSLKQVFALYKRDGGKMLRPITFVCDVWLALFG